MSSLHLAERYGNLRTTPLDRLACAQVASSTTEEPFTAAENQCFSQRQMAQYTQLRSSDWIPGWMLSRELAAQYDAGICSLDPAAQAFFRTTGAHLKAFQTSASSGDLPSSAGLDSRSSMVFLFDSAECKWAWNLTRNRQLRVFLNDTFHTQFAPTQQQSAFAYTVRSR